VSAKVHDVIGVGIGPFNLGLAALLDPVAEIDARFFDAREQFAWHHGLMLPDAEIQVPFLADLVTLADPTSPYSFLNYLHHSDRLYRFYFYERMHVLRREFDAYCRWVAERLPACTFGHRVEDVRPRPGGTWTVRVSGPAGTEEHVARNVVVGVGTLPAVPECAIGELGPNVVHSADYLPARERALASPSVAVIGSGQSAAEVVADLLDNAAPGTRLRWYTRSDGFLPMEYSKLGLEHFSPEYTAYFHGLPPERRDALRAGQDLLYKGIDAGTSARIYDALYRRSVDAPDADLGYAARCELRGVDSLSGGRGVRLRLHHLDQDTPFACEADLLVLATGYREAPLPAAGLNEVAALDPAGRPVVELDYRVQLRDGSPSTLFVQNAALHTHGVGTPDLGLGAHRNAVIANTICGREVYPVRERNVFQGFGAPLPAPAARDTRAA